MQPYTLIHNNVWNGIFRDTSIDSGEMLDTITRLEDENIAHMEKINDDCRRAGSLQYRCFHVQVADGYAYYQIMEVMDSKVRVRHIEGIGENYKDEVLGDGGVFPLIPIKRLIDAEDAFNDLISKRKLAD